MPAVFSVFLALFVFSVQLLSAASSPLRVEVSAKGAILMNAETGAVLWEKNAHTALIPSSTTKMITALYAMEKKGGGLDEEVTASHEAVAAVSASVRRAVNGSHPPYRLEFGGTHMGIKAGEVMPLRTLLYGLMLVSGNDAANVIAQHVSGDVATFMQELNLYVRSKGCKNTVLHTPHGLPHEEHKTTAYDMALLAQEFLKNELLREIVKTPQYVRQATNKQPESMLYQHNALVKPGRFFYPKAIGIKTGYTVAGGYALVTAAESEERTLIVVLLGCDKIEQRYKDAIALFEAGFNEKKVARILFSKGFDLFSHQVEGGNMALQAYLPQDIVLSYYPSEEPVFRAAIQWQPPALPILPGSQVAQLQILSSDGKVLTSAPLLAVRGVEATLRHRGHLAWNRLKRGVWGHVTLVMALGGTLLLAGAFYYSRSRRGQ